jgi:hypothetical protein
LSTPIQILKFPLSGLLPGLPALMMMRMMSNARSSC